jgi:uncharacterized membrane protein YraQ (UPF0718 family)
MIDYGTIFLWVLALGLGWKAFQRHTARSRGGLKDAGERFLVIMPRIAVALLAAGFLAKLMPGDAVARSIGAESGLGGILLASAVGGVIPGGPILSFPLIVILYKAGAGIPQLVAFLTAWSVFAFHRVLIYEVAMMGWRFSAVRIISSLILPPLAGLLAIPLSLVFKVA